MKKLILASLVILIGNPMLGMQPILRLINAAEAGDAAQVQHLLDAGVSVDQVDADGETALMWAAYTGREQIVRLLLGVGASVNQTNWYGSTALMWAARRDYGQIVRLLLDAGASVNHVSKNGSTALKGAAYNGYEPMCTLLVERMLKIPNDAQRLKMRLVWLSQKRALHNKDLRGYMMRFLLDSIEEENREYFQNSVAKREVDKIDNDNIKQRLLDKYGQDNAERPSKRHIIGWCAIQ